MLEPREILASNIIVQRLLRRLSGRMLDFAFLHRAAAQELTILRIIAQHPALPVNKANPTVVSLGLSLRNGAALLQRSRCGRLGRSRSYHHLWAEHDLEVLRPKRLGELCHGKTLGWATNSCKEFVQAMGSTHVLQNPARCSVEFDPAVKGFLNGRDPGPFCTLVDRCSIQRRVTANINKVMYNLVLTCWHPQLRSACRMVSECTVICFANSASAAMAPGNRSCANGSLARLHPINRSGDAVLVQVQSNLESRAPCSLVLWVLPNGPILILTGIIGPTQGCIHVAAIGPVWM
mmetsp:Transcript_166794/g.535365  ORF Transcript_166794/g.535365 Transcript_166794/m.535365 type:complete len:292 (-) Transcript_166794:1180-2055(-)